MPTKTFLLNLKTKYVIQLRFLLNWVFSAFRKEQYKKALFRYKCFRILQHNYFGKRVISLRKPIKERDYLKNIEGSYTKLHDAVEVEIVGPNFTKAKQQKQKFTYPELYYGVLKNVGFTAITNYIIPADKYVIHQDFFAENIDRLNHKSESEYIPFKDSNCMIVDAAKQQVQTFKGAITICLPFTNNYYHWLVEVIPKFQFINNLPSEFDDYPLLVNGRVKKVPQLLDVLKVYQTKKREVVYLDAGTNVKVDNLVVIDALSWILLDLRYGEKNLLTDSVIHPLAISFLRSILPVKTQQENKKKIYLSRKNQAVRKFNEQEVIDVLETKEFEIIYPENLSFLEQVALFNGAEYIVAPTGAALTNLVYCKPNTKAICLISTNWNLGYFSNIAYQVGVDLKYIVSNYDEHEGANIRIWERFEVSVTELKNVINQWES